MWIYWPESFPKCSKQLELIISISFFKIKVIYFLACVCVNIDEILIGAALILKPFY